VPNHQHRLDPANVQRKLVNVPVALSGQDALRASALAGRRSWYSWVKDPAEFCLALVLLVLASPVILCAMLAVKVTSRGPAFYSQVRFGRQGRPFAVYKIRSMTHECEAQSGICWSTHGDPRVTPVGRFLRATHIDELPQFWNVLRGEMSLVGPRPERPEFVATLEKVVPRYRERLSVRPGLTASRRFSYPPTRMSAACSANWRTIFITWRICPFFLELRILAATVLKVLGFPRWMGRVVFALPGGEEVERAYRLSIRATGDNSRIDESSLPAVLVEPTRSLEPA